MCVHVRFHEQGMEFKVFIRLHSIGLTEEQEKEKEIHYPNVFS